MNDSATDPTARSISVVHPTQVPKGSPLNRPQADMHANDAREPTAEEKAGEMARRQRKWDTLEAAAADGTGPSMEGASPALPRENVDCIEVDLPNGMHVVYGPRTGTNLSWDTAEILGDDTRNPLLTSLTKVSLCVRSIDGRDFKKPGNKIEARKIANILGEESVDALYLIHDEVWPNVTKKDLPTIKKIFR